MTAFWVWLPSGRLSRPEGSGDRHHVAVDLQSVVTLDNIDALRW